MSSSRTLLRGTRSRIAAVLATLIGILGGLIVVILVAYVVLTLGQANPASDITRFVTYWSERFQLGFFRDLFTPADPRTRIPADPRTRIAIDYGLAAAFWFVVSWALVRMAQRLS